MQVRIRESGAVMYEDEFRRLNASTSFPQVISAETLNDYGADVVFEGPQASGGTVYQYSQASGVEQISGKWYTKHILGPVFTDGETTAAEQEAAYKVSKDAEHAKSIRTSRNQMLKDCDWTRLDDTPLSNTVKATWAIHRQALRDVPAQNGFPRTVTWPVAP